MYFIHLIKKKIYRKEIVKSKQKSLDNSKREVQQVFDTVFFLSFRSLNIDYYVKCVLIFVKSVLIFVVNQLLKK